MMKKSIIMALVVLSIIHIRIDVMAKDSGSGQDPTSFSYYEAMDFKYEEEEPFGYIFSCYDVNKDGEILLTFNSLFSCRIQIYDKEMKYIKGYYFPWMQDVYPFGRMTEALVFI